MSTPREITTKRKLDQRRLTVAERKRAAAVLRSLAAGVLSIDDFAAAGFLSSSEGQFLLAIATRLRRTDPPSARHIALALAWLGAVVNQKMFQYARPAHPDQFKPENIVRVCHAAADALAGPQAAARPQSDGWQELPDSARDVLQAMFEARAFSVEARLSAAEIATRALGANTDPKRLKHPLAVLACGPLVSRKLGRGGGYWLTPDGRKLARKHVK